MSTFDEKGNIPVDRGVIVSCVGKKRGGKSAMAMQIFRTYPYDRVVIDVAGDDGPMRDDDPTFVRLTGTVHEGSLPDSWPEHLRHEGKPMTLVYAPDAGSPTELEDMDHVVGLAFSHGGCCLLVHEIGRLAPANRTPANMRRVLMHNRHNQVTAIFCGPRPAGIDPLVLAQSDLVYIFDLPRKDDRDRVSADINWNRTEFDDHISALQEHEFLRYDANVPKPPDGTPPEKDMRLVHFAALPLGLVQAGERWAHPKGRPSKLDEHRAKLNLS